MRSMKTIIDIDNILNSHNACILWCNINELSELNFSELLLKLNMEIIDKDEYDKIKRFRMLNDQKRSLLSILLMKLCLGNYYTINPKQIKIIRNKGTKPHFKLNSSDKTELSFNVSHDGEIVIIILSKFLVGIDIMKSELPIRNKENIENKELKMRFFKNMYNVFDKDEWNYINNDIVKFMRYWTIKECFVKCIGYGLYIDPKRLKIRNNRNNNIYLNSINVTTNDIYLDDSFQVSNEFFLNEILEEYLNNLINICILYRTVIFIHLTVLFLITIFHFV